MNSLWKAIGLGGPAIPNFQFDLGELSGSAETPGVSWTLRSGSRLEDKAHVTIFEAKLTSANAELVRNCAKKAKTLMLPGFLRCYDAVEHNESVFMACEACSPLVEVLQQRDLYYEDEEKFFNAVALGLHTIGNGLLALHKNRLLYNNVNSQSVYVTRSGEWRLFGHEFVSSPDEEHSLYRRSLSLVPEHRVPPESTASKSSAPPEAVDAWGMACLIFEVFDTRGACAGNSTTAAVKPQDMKMSRAMPSPLQPLFVGLTGTNPKLRLSVEKLVQDPFFSESDYVTTILTLQELSLKDLAERDTFYRNLAAHIDNFPLRACKYIVLDKLSIAVQYGSSSAAALEPILKIGARLDEHDFATLVAPVVVALFASQDHLIRCRLLSTASQYAKLLPPNLVCEKIWPHFITGFSSKNADLRELTVRGLVHFAPLLTEKIITTDVLKGVALLQQDREGPIRTNATICLGLISSCIPPTIRSKTLVNGFGRMLKDPFVPSKVAALKCVGRCAEHMSATDIATTLLPAVCPAAVDASSEVRDVSLTTMGLLMAKLELSHKEMPKDDVPTQPAGGSAPPLSAQPTSCGVEHSRTSSDAGSAVSVSVGSVASSAPTIPSSGAAKTRSSIWSWGSGGKLAAASGDVEKTSHPAPAVPNVSSGVPPARSPSASESSPQHGDPMQSDVTMSQTQPVARPGSLKLGAAKKKGFGGGAASKVE